MSPEKGTLKKGTLQGINISHQTGKGKSSSKCHFLGGYVSFLEGKCHFHDSGDIVDASEIPRPTTWDVSQTRRKEWDKLPTSTGEFAGFLVAINSSSIHIGLVY